MTKLKELPITANEIDILISTAKREYLSDTSWSYRGESKEYVVSFSQDETGKNHIDEFVKFYKGHWINIMPSDSQIAKMYAILNNTPYREDEFIQSLASSGKVCEYLGEHWWEENVSSRWCNTSEEAKALGWHCKPEDNGVVKERICRICHKKQVYKEEWEDE